jgi:hypothetical protein
VYRSLRRSRWSTNEATLEVAFFIPAPLREAAMTQTTHPTKQLVRDYMDERTRSDDPPPALAGIRRQLGWDLLPPNRQPDRADRD